MGRLRAWASPSKSTGPSANAATGGTNRITVPARPQSTSAERSLPGDTRMVSPSSSMAVPMARSAFSIRSVSRERSAPTIVDGPDASADKT